MDWKEVGGWLKENAGTGAALVGSLLTGNAAGVVAAGVALVSSATGTNDPEKALAALQSDPTTLLRLRELAVQDADNIRRHLQTMEEARLKDEQAAHREQQETIRNGDNSADPYVRHTRPRMARQSWAATVVYVFVFEGAKAADLVQTGAVVELALLLLGPAAAYLGFRSWDKRNVALGKV